MPRLLIIVHTILLLLRMLLGQIMVLLSDVIGHLDTLIITTNVLLRRIILSVACGALPSTAWYLD